MDHALPYRPCVGIMLVNAQGAVFVGKRIDNPADFWQMPQGGIDKGEDPRDAALRELQEETGVTPDLVRVRAETADWLLYDLPPELIGKIWKGKYRGQRQKWFLFEFLGQDSQIDIHAGEAEFSAWRWAPLDSLVAKIVPFKQEVYAAVVQEFEPLIK